MWTGTSWAAQSPLPDARAGHAAAAFGSEVLVFGGEVAGSTWNTAHSHELVRRTAGTFTTVPLTVPAGVAAFDRLRSRMVAVDATTTLESDGFTWIDTGIVPPALLIALASHAGNGGIVGIDAAGTTWTFDGVAWVAPPVLLQPPARNSTALAHDLLRNRVVLFGGHAGSTPLADVWEWDGVAWSNPIPAATPPAGAAAMAWDAAGQRVVLVPSTTTATTPTYAWDGVAWTTITTGPGVYHATRLAEHPGGVVLVATTPQTYSVAEGTWLLAGNAWTPLGTLDERRVHGSLAFDGNRGEVVLLDTWQRREWILSLHTPNAIAAGTGCAGSAGIPELRAANLPQLGTAAVADLFRAVPGSVALWLGDIAGANVTLPGGCTQLVANPIVLAAAPTNTVGFASASWPIPASPAVRGIVVHTQALTLDPNGALFGIASLTAALRLRIGD
jgi:hypothetical protein